MHGVREVIHTVISLGNIVNKMVDAFYSLLYLWCYKPRSTVSNRVPFLVIFYDTDL
jgi:hypothetical protein